MLTGTMHPRTILLLVFLITALEARSQEAPDPWQDGLFSWQASGPLVDVGEGRNAPDPHVAIKDPTVVFHEARWHLFATLRMKSGKVCMAYLTFSDWTGANAGHREVLSFQDAYHCAPQVFYFTPHRRWYLIFQLADETRKPAFGPYFSTTTDLGNAKSWTKPEPMMTNAPEKPKWLDFWVICDAENAHLFYTSLDGKMWRCETRKADFPKGWSEPSVALKGDIFEASHTYKLKGRERYLTVIEAQAPGRRYYKAYLADGLRGPWRGLAETREKAFAARENIRQAPHWTDSISHGELIRAGIDERLEVDPAKLRFVFQGASESEYRGSQYGGIPWRLGLLELAR